MTPTNNIYSHGHLQQFQFCSLAHTQPFYSPFPGPPGWASARRELLDFVVQGKINRGRHTDHPARFHSIRTNQCPPPPSPIFLQVGCPSCWCPSLSAQCSWKQNPKGAQNHNCGEPLQPLSASNPLFSITRWLLVGWGLTELLTQNRSYRACKFVGIFHSKL